MCGRYTLHQKANEIAKRFNIARVPASVPESYNVAPGQIMPVIVGSEHGPKLELMKWGLIPRWSKDPKMGYKLINARAETVHEKPMWQKLVRHQRALIPANGFYEWKKPAHSKDLKRPFYIRPKHTSLFAFAGVWETWQDVEGLEWKTFAIITTEANKEMAEVHSRMPVILHQEDEATWLEPSLTSRDNVEPLLRPYEDGGLTMHEVSRDVNVVENNDHMLIYPINSQ